MVSDLLKTFDTSHVRSMFAGIASGENEGKTNSSLYAQRADNRRAGREAGGCCPEVSTR